MARNHVNNVSVRPDYFGPASYDPRRVDVGVRGMAARKTSELVAGLAVSLFDVTANAALPRSVARVDVQTGSLHARPSGDLRLKIAKGPRVQNTSLRPGSSYPRTDAVEVLDSDTERGAFGRSDNLPAEMTVIYVLRKAALLHASLAKQSLRALGALRLKSLSELHGAATSAFKVRAREVLSVARCSDIDDPNVHAKPAEEFLFFGVRYVYGHEEEPLRIAEREVGFAALRVEQYSLAITADERDCLTTRRASKDSRYRSSKRVCGRRMRSSRGYGSVAWSFCRACRRRPPWPSRSHDHLRGQVGGRRARASR